MLIYLCINPKLPLSKTKIESQSNEREVLIEITARYEISPGIRAIAISSLLIVGLFSAIGISIPTTTSPDSEFVAYPEYAAHEKWSSAHGADGHEGDKISSTRYPPVSASFVALKDCNDKPLQQQQT